MVSGCRQLSWTYCRQGQWHLGADDNLAGLIIVKDNGIWMQKNNLAGLFVVKDNGIWMQKTT